MQAEYGCICCTCDQMLISAPAMQALSYKIRRIILVPQSICDWIWENPPSTHTTANSLSNDRCTTIWAGIGTEGCPGCFYLGLFLRLVRSLWVLGWPLNDFLSSWQARSQLYFVIWLADEFVHGFSCFVWLAEVKMALMDTI